jgi:hypothetical protein
MKLLRKVSKVTGYIEMDGNLVLTPADVSREELVKSCEDLSNQTVVLNNRLHKSNDEVNDLKLKIEGVRGVILDYISINGNLDNDELKEIAEILKMKLTKTVDIEYTVKYTGSAEIPLDVDVDDIDWEDEVSFHVDTNSEHDIDLTEDSVDVDVREMN